MLDRPLTLSVAAIARTVSAERLGELHVTVAPEPLWFPRGAEEEAAQAARAELAAAGGIDRRGRVDADMVALLSMLCTPRMEFYGWISHQRQTRGVLVAVSGRTALLVTQDSGIATIAPVRPEAPAEALVAQTPEVPAGRGQVVTVVGEDVRTAAGGRQRTASGVGVRQAPPAVREVQRITGLPTTGGGQLFTAVRDNAGRRVRVPHPLRYIDTVEGRYVNATVGDDQVLIAPVDRSALTRRVYDLHRSL